VECCSPQPDVEQFAELLRKPINWNALLALAERHGVLAHLAVRLNAISEANIPEQARKALHDLYRAQIIHTLRITAELLRLAALLKGEGLEIPVVKGPTLSARAYGDAGRRHYGDLDFLARHEEIARITPLLQKAGYQATVPATAIEAGKIPGQYLFFRPDSPFVVEFHTERTLRYFPKPLPIEEFYRRRTHVNVDGREVPALALEDEFVLICIHGAKHFWERLIWIADVAAISAQKGTIDWSQASATAATVGAERMVRAGLYLGEKILRAAVPQEMEKAIADDKGLLRMKEKVEKWLPAAGDPAPGVMERAAFRMAMHGGGVSGAGYLLRLLFSPTEEDWQTGADSRGSRNWEAARRPFRLAKKYGRGSS
jgi:hypothetical protein